MSLLGRTQSIKLSLGLALSVAFVGPIHASQDTPKTKLAKTAKSRVIVSSPTPAVIHPDLSVLTPLVGSWKFKESHYNERGEVVTSVRGTEEIKWILDGNALQRNYFSGERDPIYRAVGTLAWDVHGERFVGVWFNNRSETGPSRVEGKWVEDTQSFVFTLHSQTASGKPLQYRIVEKLESETRRVATTFELKGPKIIKRLVVEYERTIPCPLTQKPRIIIDN